MDRYAWVLSILSLTSVMVSAQGRFSTSLVDHSPNVVPARMAEILAASDAGMSKAINRRFWLIGGHEFDWLQPRLSNNVSAVVSRSTGNRALAFDLENELTSRVWVGVENDRCNGIRARYWFLDTNAPTQVNFATAGSSPISVTIEGAGGNLSRTAVANVGDVMTSRYHLEMRTIDLEGTHRIRRSCSEAIATFGLRYVKTHQRSHFVATDSTGSLTELVCQDVDFQGLGPTLSGEFTRHLLRTRFLRSCVSGFATTRGSLLIGDQEQDMVLVTSGGGFLAEDDYRHEDVMPIVELAGGLQWSVRASGRASWFVRTGYRAESWFGAGGPVDSDSNLSLHGVLLSVAARY